MPEKSPQKLPQEDIIRGLREVTDNNADLILVDVITTPDGQITFVKEDPDNNIVIELGGIFKKIGEDPGETVDPGTEETAGKLSIASTALALRGEDDTTAMTPLKTAQQLDAELNERGLVASTLQNVAERQSQTGQPITADIESLARITAETMGITSPAALTAAQKAMAKVVYWLPDGDLVVAELDAVLNPSLIVTPSYDIQTDVLSLATTGNAQPVRYTIPELNVAGNLAINYPVPAQLRSGNTTLNITAVTDTQTARTSILVPAEALGSFYILGIYVALNLFTDGTYSISTFVKGKGGPSMRRKIVGRNGTFVPPSYAGVFRVMPNEPEGYQKPGLFPGVAPYAGLELGCGKGDYTMTVDVENHPDVLMTFDFSFSDTQTQLVVFESPIQPPANDPVGPEINEIVIVTGRDFSIEFPPFIGAPIGSTYDLNYKPNGSTFNSTTRTLSGKVPVGEVIQKEVQYYVTVPGGQNYVEKFPLKIIDDNMPRIDKAKGVFNDDDPSIPGFAAHQIFIKSLNQPAGTVPQIGNELENGNQGVFWFNASPLNDGSEFNFREAHQVSPFSQPEHGITHVLYYLRQTPTSPAILFYRRNILDTPQNRVEFIINYPNVEVVTPPPTPTENSSVSIAVAQDNPGGGIREMLVLRQVWSVVNGIKTCRFFNDAVINVPPGSQLYYFIDEDGQEVINNKLSNPYVGPLQDFGAFQENFHLSIMLSIRTNPDSTDYPGGPTKTADAFAQIYTGTMPD